MSYKEILNPDDGKILPEFIPGYGVAENLTATLTAGNSASNLDMTDVGTIYCADVQAPFGTIEALSAKSIGDVDSTGLSINPSIGPLKIKGAISKGTLLVGDGDSTESLPPGVNGLVLTTNSAVPLGVEWTAGGGGGGGVSSVSAGTNITVTGTATNPIVNLKAPLTSTLNMGSTSITDSAASTGLASQYLTAGTGGQTLWATLPTSVASVSAGTNISITGTATAPIINLRAPLTSTLDVGSQTISSSTGSITIQPVAGQDINALVDGTGRLHITQSGTGGLTQPALSVENNNGNANPVEIDFYKNSASPVASDGLGTVSFHGNSSTLAKREYGSIAATITKTTNGSETGNLTISVCNNSSVPTPFLTVNGFSGVVETNKPIDTKGNQISTTSGAVNLYQSLLNQNIGLTNVATGGSIFINKSGTGGTLQLTSASSASLQASSSVSISSTGAGISLVAQPGTGIITNQGVNARTILRSGLGTGVAQDYLDYYPSVNIDNNFQTSYPVPQPRIPYQNLTLINLGVSPNAFWNDAPYPSTPTDWTNCSVFGYHPATGTYWIAYNYGSGSIIYITADLLTTGQVIALSGSSYSGSTSCKCFYADGSSMFIGGDFTTVNTNAQNQSGITKINCAGGLGSFAEDPIWDSGTTVSGVSGYVNTITMLSGELYCGGLCSTFTNGTTIHNVFRVGNLGGGAGAQTFDDYSGYMGVNAEVYCSATSGANVFFGGQFTAAAYPFGFPLQLVNYFAAFETASGPTYNWVACDANNFNAPVYSCAYSVHGSYIYCTGQFTQSAPDNFNTYIDANFPGNPRIASGLSTCGPTTNRNCISNGSGQDVMMDQAGNVFRSTSFGSWTDLSVAFPATGTPSGLINQGGNNIYASASNQGYIRQLTILPDTVTFSTGGSSFRYAGGTYTTVTLSGKWTSQAFISDSAGIYYYPVGSPVCTFS